MVLGALARQSMPAHDFEVVVVLDGECSETLRILATTHFPFKIRSFVQPHRGAPAARNIGLSQARSDFVLFLDDDAVPTPDMLLAHLQCLASGHQIVIGGLKPSPDPLYPLVSEVVDWTDVHFRRCSEPDYQVSHTDLPDGNFSARRQDLLLIGGWDESFCGFGGDDDRELGWRLKLRGFQFHFEPRALGYHFYSKPWSRLLQDRRQTGRAHSYYFTKHPDRIREFGFPKWITRSCWRRMWFRLWGHAPDSFFDHALREIERWGDHLDPRCGRAMFRALVKLTGTMFYSRGYWEDHQVAMQIYRLLRIRVPILCYHSVARRNTKRSELTIPIHDFETQIQYLAAHGYQTVSLNDVYSWSTHLRPLPPKPVVITFDDGYAGFSQEVAPILLHHGFRATIFVIAGKCGCDVIWEGHHPMRIMGYDEMRALGERGFCIQAHGVEHNDWTRISVDMVKQELRGSKSIIESITGSPVRFAAYPFGKWTRSVRDTVVSEGYLGACTIERGQNGFDQDMFALRRDLILPSGGWWRFRRALLL